MGRRVPRTVSSDLSEDGRAAALEQQKRDGAKRQTKAKAQIYDKTGSLHLQSPFNNNRRGRPLHHAGPEMPILASRISDRRKIADQMRHIGHILPIAALALLRWSGHGSAMKKTDPELPPDSAMPALRARIDALDARLVLLLAERSALIDEAARIKAREHLPARIDSRVEEVAGNARRLAVEHGLDPELAERLWRVMMEHFIAQEDRVLSAPKSD